MTSECSPAIVAEKQKPYFLELMTFLKKEREHGKKIYPAESDIFNALKLAPLDKVKVVILGQDPYHGAGQAHGLAFSVQRGVPIPPSLANIYKELKADIGFVPPAHGNLEAWAREGVLLLNTVLTVEEGRPGSHHGKGWEEFTNRIVQILCEQRENLVFILWGNPAQKKARMVDPQRHHIIASAHPSPLSCYRGFLGSKPFSQTNNYLISKGIAPVNWNLPS